MEIQTEATIESARRVKRHHRGTGYKLEFIWTDGGGLRRKVEDVAISHAPTETIVVGN